MILVRSPLRMSFVGGGSDMKVFYSSSPGKVLASSIDKYVYVAVKERFEGGIRLSYSENEICETVSEIRHPIVRECLRLLDINEGIEIVSMADIPGTGSGLGSSSSFTAAVLLALHRFKGCKISSRRIAELACEIEISRCGEPIGKQDQYATAIGGMNKFTFLNDESVLAQPITLPESVLSELNDNLLILYTGATRSASAVLSEQQAQVSSSEQKRSILKSMVSLVDQFEMAIKSADLAQASKILHENWMLKKNLAKSISPAWVDEAYDRALSLGAQGGKILGAGAGGFFMFIAKPELHCTISEALRMPKMNVSLINDGCQIVFE